MNFTNFKWVNETEIRYEDNNLTLIVNKHFHFFNNPLKENDHLMDPVEKLPFSIQNCKVDDVFGFQLSIDGK